MGILETTHVDLLLTDYAMPAMTGAELAETARLKWPALAIVMVSGFAELPEGKGLGIARLAKPFRQHQLASAIADVLPEMVMAPI